jgi:hypothetical protein
MGINLLELAYQLDPVLWVKQELKLTPTSWQEQYLRAAAGSSILVLTARQVGKTTTAAWAIAHCMLYRPGSLSVIACPTQTQSAEAVRRVRVALDHVGAKFKSDNVYGLELENGSRVKALPGAEDSVRGLTVDGWIVADEAARLDPEMIAALGPMRARKPEARLAMLSTAWEVSDPFWTAWDGDDSSWMRLQCVGVDAHPLKILERERPRYGDNAFNREYMGIPSGGAASLFTVELYQKATLVPAGSIPCAGVIREDPSTWVNFKPTIVAHDVGASRDRSTAVVGGPAWFNQQLIGITEYHELQQNLYGSARADHLAATICKYPESMIVVDLSFDPTYAESLYQRFGPRLIGLKITASGDGMECEERRFKNGRILVYKVSRNTLIEGFHEALQLGHVRLTGGRESMRAFQQLMALQTQTSARGLVYNCPSGQHDDLGISCAMLAFVARHPHFQIWVRNMFRTPAPKRQEYGWGAFT